MILILNSLCACGSTRIQRRPWHAWTVRSSPRKRTWRNGTATLWAILLLVVHWGFATLLRNPTSSRQLHCIVQCAFLSICRLCREQWTKWLRFVFESGYILDATLERIKIGRDASDSFGQSGECLTLLSASRFIHIQADLLTDTFVEIINFKSSNLKLSVLPQ